MRSPLPASLLIVTQGIQKDSSSLSLNLAQNRTKSLLPYGKYNEQDFNSCR